MYADILACRALEQSKVRAWLVCRGREAGLIGVVHNLLPKDRVSMSGDAAMLRLLLAEGGNRLLACTDDTAERMDVAAKATKRAKNALVAVYVDADEPLDWLETMKSAGKLDLPMIFICEDNATMKQRERDWQWKKIQKAARRREVPVIPVDGKDVVAMYRAAQEAMSRARMGLGPTVLWCERWTHEAQEPVQMFEGYLTAHGLLNAAEKKRLTAAPAKKMRSIG